MNDLLKSISFTRHALVWALLVETVPVCVFEFLKDMNWQPAPEHTLGFILSFLALLVMTGVSSMRLRNHATENGKELTS